jgi:prevent-host-death family protein
MRTVGVGALRQRASELLRLVEQGETIEVTNHGRVVAVLAPPPEIGPWERLVATGEVTLATGDIDD